ncbi:hypothetical protein MAPG_08100, partial [Magnaporthiopsis poae ATCC 64411]
RVSAVTDLMFRPFGARFRQQLFAPQLLPGVRSVDTQDFYPVGLGGTRMGPTSPALMHTEVKKKKKEGKKKKERKKKKKKIDTDIGPTASMLIALVVMWPGRSVIRQADHGQHMHLASILGCRGSHERDKHFMYHHNPYRISGRKPESQQTAFCFPRTSAWTRPSQAGFGVKRIPTLPMYILYRQSALVVGGFVPCKKKEEGQQ